MKLKRWISIILLSGGMLGLVACHSKHNRDQAAINDANAAYASDAQSSGIGEDSSFGDQAGKQSLNKRVYYFDFDSDVVHDADKPAIEANATYLMAHENAKALLEGHTDPRGSREYNIGLGERRAKAVAMMMKHAGVNPDQIRIVSYGAQKLAVPGHSESDYQKDRRVVLVYLQR